MSSPKDGRRFDASQETTLRDLQRIIGKIGASSLRIEQDIMTGGVKVIFDRAGKRYTRECTRWRHSTDNLRAIGLQIDYLYRALELYGVDMKETSFEEEFDTIFAGFLPPPDDTALLLGSGSSSCWDVLGVRDGATKAEIRSAYKALARVHHPDYGGDPSDFRKLDQAYKEAIKNAKE